MSMNRNYTDRKRLKKICTREDLVDLKEEISQKGKIGNLQKLEET